MENSYTLSNHNKAAGDPPGHTGELPHVEYQNPNFTANRRGGTGKSKDSKRPLKCFQCRKRKKKCEFSRREDRCNGCEEVGESCGPKQDASEDRDERDIISKRREFLNKVCELAEKRLQRDESEDFILALIDPDSKLWNAPSMNNPLPPEIPNNLLRGSDFANYDSTLPIDYNPLVSSQLSDSVNPRSSTEPTYFHPQILNLDAAPSSHPQAFTETAELNPAVLFNNFPQDPLQQMNVLTQPAFDNIERWPDLQMHTYGNYPGETTATNSPTSGANAHESFGW